MAGCKITVLKRNYDKELCDEYLDIEKDGNFDGCSRFKVGDEFIVKDHEDIPENFCVWAWGDIKKDILTIMYDGNFPWAKKKGINIACCSDGVMPVVFKVEKIK